MGSRQHLHCTGEDKERVMGRIGVDWWATIVAGVIVLLAVAGLLAKIGW